MKTNVKISYLYLTLLSISVFLVIGSKDSQIEKSNVVSKYFLFPFITTIEYFQSVSVLELKNDILKEEIFLIEQKNNIMMTKLIKLSSELNMRENIVSDIDSIYNNLGYTPAKIISNPYSVSEKIIQINKGRKDGVRINDSVVSQFGVVGKVMSVSPTTSLLLPFSNMKSNIAVMNSLNVQGILSTDYNGILRMSFIEKNSEISTGDTLYTSNLSDVFRGYNVPVGVVDSVVIAPNNLYFEAYVAPFTVLNNLAEVYIMRNK